MIATTDPTITFDGLGKTNLVGAATIQVTNPTGGACQTSATAGKMRCLNVTVSVGGQVKMCDPHRNGYRRFPEMLTGVSS